jgi:hypothetical protein
MNNLMQTSANRHATEIERWLTKQTSAVVGSYFEFSLSLSMQQCESQEKSINLLQENCR